MDGDLGLILKYEEMNQMIKEFFHVQENIP